MRWRRTTFEQLDGTVWTPADDGVLIGPDGRTCARVYRAGGPMAGRWFWSWQRPPTAAGYAETKDAAKAECERRAAAQLHSSENAG